jgi:hypothetical protein
MLAKRQYERKRVKGEVAMTFRNVSQKAKKNLEKLISLPGNG